MEDGREGEREGAGREERAIRRALWIVYNDAASCWTAGVARVCRAQCQFDLLHGSSRSRPHTSQSSRRSSRSLRCLSFSGHAALRLRGIGHLSLQCPLFHPTFCLSNQSIGHPITAARLLRAAQTLAQVSPALARAPRSDIQMSQSHYSRRSPTLPGPPSLVSSAPPPPLSVKIKQTHADGREKYVILIS